MEEPLLRHSILNTIRSLKVKFSDEYGELILCLDGKDYWRRKDFPYYKAARVTAKEKSEFDWKNIYAFIDKIKLELDMFFPYKQVNVNTAEADDIIAVLCRRFGAESSEELGGLNIGEKVLIISGDHDFKQLQKYGNVSQYDPINKKFIRCLNPELFLKEHIIRGDVGDGVPNFLSDDDCFVNHKRQKSLSKKNVKKWLGEEPNTFCVTGELKNKWIRNTYLINFDFIPDEVSEEITKVFEEQQNLKKDRSKLMNYLIENRLKALLENIQDF